MGNPAVVLAVQRPKTGNMRGIPALSSVEQVGTPVLMALSRTSTLICECPRPIKCPNSCVKARSEEHTSELQSQSNIVCRLLLEKKTKSEACEDRSPPDVVFNLEQLIFAPRAKRLYSLT